MTTKGNAIVAALSIFLGAVDLAVLSPGWAVVWFAWAALNVWAIDTVPARRRR